MKHKLVDLEKQLAIESSKNKNLLLEMRANERNLELMNSTLNLKLKDKATNETIMGIEKMLNESSVSMKHKLIDLEKQLAIESSKNKNLLLEMRANERNL